MRATLFFLAGVTFSACSPAASKELCNNQVDDDGNGLRDCADPVCAADPTCPFTHADAGFFGTCQKCGRFCAQQAECLATTYSGDDPLPQCQKSVCAALLEGIDVRFEVNTSAWTGVSATIRSMNTRFVLEKALDGTVVSCATLAALASSTSAADADQIERTGRFNLLAFDVAPVQAAPGTVIIQPYLPTGTGSDFLIWVELWNGGRDSDTKLPTGLRLGWGCFESGPEVEPLKTEHHWPNTGPLPTSRTIRVLMPAPQ
ncbi:MAG: hypothetical protein ACOZIN_04965 [Myxococcota bacterium]